MRPCRTGMRPRSSTISITTRSLARPNDGGQLRRTGAASSASVISSSLARSAANPHCSGSNKPHSSWTALALVARALARATKARAVQDEWGLFDPEQCGFAALLAKLDEITLADEAAPVRRS